MPPPIAGDSWLAGRRFGIVIDAGSSGSRLQIYSWKDPRFVLESKGGDELAGTLPKVEKGTKDGEDWVKKVEPGISSFADHLDDIPGHLQPLLSHAINIIPPKLQAETPLYLLATAGMRLLTPEQQANVLTETCHFLSRHSNFKIDSQSINGPCGSSVRIITGEEEGLFGWIAVNYLMDGFASSSTSRTTYGFLDMGGASTQIAFEPSSAYQKDNDNLMSVRLRLLGGKEITHQVFVATWLGYGTNQARERYVGSAINELEQGRHGGDDDDVVSDPCLPKHLELTETPVHSGSASDHAKKTHRLIGTGSFEQCMKKSSSLLNKDAPCPDSTCLMNGTQVPPIDFSVSHFIGVSEYWFSSEHVFGLGGPYNFVEYERAASKFCSREWDDIVKEHEQSKHSGDGEVENKDGQIVQVGKWGPEVELSRLKMQCFKAAWIVNVLHEGLGMPRIVDPEGNSTGTLNEVAKQAKEKGLGRPTFQSVDSIGDIAISWTLGKMVLEASREVPPLPNAKPIVDPIDDIPETKTSPIRPIRPLSMEAIENSISRHLPYSLTRPSLGFSPVILLYALVFILLLLITWPLWRRLRPVFLRSLRSFARGRDTDTYSLEEGIFLNGNGTSHRGTFSTPSSPKKPWHPFQKLIPRARPGSRTSGRANTNRPPSLNLASALVSGEVSLKRESPLRSNTYPAINVSSSSNSANASPLPSPHDDEPFEVSGSIYHSRSRNGSQVNLNNVIVPRSISRVNSEHSFVD